MAECGRDRSERTSIGHIAKAHKKYGSTSNHMKKNEVYIKHTVAPEDTLQGIALKYGVTTEQIRRINKIWMNDSLFLRPSLDIPVPKDLADLRHTDSVSISLSSSGEETLQRCSSEFASPRSVTSDELGEVQDTEQTVADILGRIDSTIAQTKSNVQKMELNNDIFFDDSSLFHHRAQESNHQSLGRVSPDPNVIPQPLVMTKGRKVKSSLQRLEKERDELFEL